MKRRSRSRRSLALLFLVVALIATGCSDSPTAPASADEEPVQEAIDSFRSAHQGVLSAIGVVRTVDGELLAGSSGFLDDTETEQIGSDTKFSIGSTTKTFTATMVLQLVEEGLVDLDGPVGQYLAPDWKAVLDSVQFGSEITVQQALGHRSGIYDYLISPLQAQMLSEPEHDITPLEAFQFVLSGPPDFQPGTDFNYSNTNYLLLGHLVENLTGQTYEEALQTRILDPAGLQDTFRSHGSSQSQRRGMAHSYAMIGGNRFDVHDFGQSGWSRGVGGLISTTGDLVKFMDALGSGQLFTDSQTLQMMTDLGENTWYGLGVQIDDQPGVGRCFGHGGYSFGSTAQVRHCPEAGVTLSAFYASDGTLLGANLDIFDRMLSALQ